MGAPVIQVVTAGVYVPFVGNILRRQLFMKGRRRCFPVVLGADVDRDLQALGPRPVLRAEANRVMRLEVRFISKEGKGLLVLAKGHTVGTNDAKSIRSHGELQGAVSSHRDTAYCP